MPEIPRQLCERGYRFILIPKGKKNPIETDWTTTKNYEFDDSKLAEHLKNGGNYGVVCGFNGLVVLDTDTPELTEAIEKTVPKTFKVKTGSGNYHFYLRCPSFNLGKIPLTLSSQKKHYGDLQAWGAQVVGPGSLHPNGNFYEIADDASIATVEKDFLMDMIAPFRDHPKMPEIFNANGNDIPISNVINLSSLKQHGSEYQGAHPYHGSTTGWNFTVNTTKNVFHCFRCGSGGGPFQLIGVMEGIVSCDDPILRGDDFLKVLEIAEKRYGYKRKAVSLKREEKSAEKEEKTSWSFEEMMKEPDVEQSYIVRPLIPEGKLIMLGGRPESGKSIFALFLALNVSAGYDFFGFSSTKSRVLYLDAEMGKPVVRERIKFLDNVYKFGNESNFQWKMSDMKGIIEETNQNDYDVIIIDSYRRFLRGAENDSEVVNAFFKSVLKPLLRNGKTIILIHHFRKKSKEMSDDDMMELFRGSSDTIAQLDLAYGMTKDEEKVDLESGEAVRKFTLYVVKNRLGLPLTDLSFKITKNDKKKETTITLEAYKKQSSTQDHIKETIMKMLEDGEIHEREEISFNIEKELGTTISWPTIHEALKSLLWTGKVQRPRKGQYQRVEIRLDSF